MFDTTDKKQPLKMFCYLFNCIEKYITVWYYGIKLRRLKKMLEKS